jgi:hypothetical protein
LAFFFVIPFDSAVIKYRYNKVLIKSKHLIVEEKENENENENTCTNIIKSGFNAHTKDYSTFSRLRNVDFMPIRYAVIPKGSEYCYIDKKTIVSNKIIVFSSKEKFDRYMKKNKKE